jgi:hypothetical protein
MNPKHGARFNPGGHLSKKLPLLVPNDGDKSSVQNVEFEETINNVQKIITTFMTTHHVQNI